MSMNTIRRATAADHAAIEAAAARFCGRHDIAVFENGESALIEVECAIGRGGWRAAELTRLWRGCYARALGERPSAGLTIAWGHVGRTCD